MRLKGIRSRNGKILIVKTQILNLKEELENSKEGKREER
jgi:hypothetical protein